MDNFRREEACLELRKDCINEQRDAIRSLKSDLCVHGDRAWHRFYWIVGLIAGVGLSTIGICAASYNKSYVVSERCAAEDAAHNKAILRLEHNDDRLADAFESFARELRGQREDDRKEAAQRDAKIHESLKMILKNTNLAPRNK